MNPFDEGNRAMHPVEHEWAYGVLTERGFVAETREAQGFVRHYWFSHPDGRRIKWCVGVNANYWEDERKNVGYWSDLESHLDRGR